MNISFSDSIILVTSIDPQYSGDFGTGFVIHQYEQTTYVLTCAHVVKDVGGSDNVKAGGHPARVEALGDVYGCDLAVLSVKDGLSELPLLKLGVVGEQGREFIVSGCYTDGTKTRKLAPIIGKLGGTQEIRKEGDRTPTWNLEISEDSEHKLKAGYSGSPVVDKASGYVLGVVAQLTEQDKGLAISIEALEKVWTGISVDIINNMNQEEVDIEVIQNPVGSERQLRDIQINDPTDNPDEDSIDKDLYLERPAIEPRCYQAILRTRCLIRIKAPWYMGKTLLMNKILQRAKKQGYLTVSLNFRSADKEHLVNLDNFLRWFCACISKQLNELGLQVQLPNRLEDYWDSTFGSKVSCKDYFQKKLLEQISENSILVLALDDVDQLDKNSEITNEFFDLLRDWYEEANKLKVWRKLRLVLSYSRKIHISDIYRSPFNVGLPIELCEFEPDEVQHLAKRNGLNWNKNQVQLLMEIVGGYPYLVQLAFERISHHYISLDDFFAKALTDTGIYRDHLQDHLLNLKEHPELKEALRNVVNANESVRLELTKALELESMGLVKLEGNNATPRRKLYRQYFKKYL